MISHKQVQIIHEKLIKEFGGAKGVRDKQLLESALKRPFEGLQNHEFYPTIEEKATAIFESIVKNHPFIDGNKRTGYVLMRLFLLSESKDIVAGENEKYEMVIETSSGNLSFEEILIWVNKHIVNK